MTKYTLKLNVSEFAQQSMKGISMAMDVANKIVSLINQVRLPSNMPNICFGL
jgi:hypothetical protein